MRVVFALALAASCAGFASFVACDGGSDARDDAGPRELPAPDASDPGPLYQPDGARPELKDCVVRTLVLESDAGIGGPDWPEANLRGSGELAVVDGGLVSRSGTDTGGAATIATLSTQRDGNVVRIRCSARVSSSSFDGDGRIIQFRIEGPRWSGSYDVWVDWKDGWLRTPYFAIPDGGKVTEYYPFVKPPSVDVVHDFTTELWLDAPQLAVTFGGVEAGTTPRYFERGVTRATVVIGTTAATESFVPHEVRFESLTCELCLAP